MKRRIQMSAGDLVVGDEFYLLPTARERYIMTDGWDDDCDSFVVCVDGPSRGTAFPLGEGDGVWVEREALPVPVDSLEPGTWVFSPQHADSDLDHAPIFVVRDGRTRADVTRAYVVRFFGLDGVEYFPGQ